MIINKIKLLLHMIVGKIQYGSYGKKSIIAKPMKITGKDKIFLGENVRISFGARIECISNWNKSNFKSSIVIDDNTSFEQFVHITSAGKIIIGHDCVFSSRVLITNIDHDYHYINKNVLEQPLIVNDVKIGDYCFIGMDVKIFPGVKIGNNVIVGANSIVLNDLPDYTVCVGTPAKPIKKYNFETKKWEKLKK